MVESIKELRKICQPEPKGREFLYIRYMRKVSIYFTKLFLILRISANQKYRSLSTQPSRCNPRYSYGSPLRGENTRARTTNTITHKAIMKRREMGWSSS